jgi:DNA-directed RNA polymerase subunit RPC12/RpoP
MKKVKYRCPTCKATQNVEYSPIMSRTLRCHKCGARFVVGPSKSKSDVDWKGGFQQSLVPCEDCCRDISSRAERCPHCGAPTPNTKVKLQKKWSHVAVVALLAAAIPIFIGFGFVHIITGSNLPAPDVVKKDSFGYSETFINIDKITGMPWLFAKSRHPIGCKVLQEKGYIESNESFMQRVGVDLGSNTLAKSFTHR